MVFINLCFFLTSSHFWQKFEFPGHSVLHIVCKGKFRHLHLVVMKVMKAIVISLG